MRRTVSGLPTAAGAGPLEAASGAPPVLVEVCTCGCAAAEHAHDAAAPVPEPEWPLATAWAWLTRPVEPGPDEDDGAESAVGLDPAADDEVDLPWWDARSRPARRRAVLPLVLLGELQAGVLLRAVWEVVQRGPGPTA